MRLLVPEFKNGVHVGDVEVEFRFSDIEQLKLENFNHQNVVSTLTFREVIGTGEIPSNPVARIYVDLDDIFGVWGTFTCSHVEVTEVITSAYKTGGGH